MTELRDHVRRLLPWVALAAACLLLTLAALVLTQRLDRSAETTATAAADVSAVEGDAQPASRQEADAPRAANAATASTAPDDGSTDADTDPGDNATPSAREANPRMADATSPYLRMHADNPVQWYRWGEAAFAKARREDKPIFLSIGYYTCYWCHVMERESFMDTEVARLINEHFVPIKIDREYRPGVDALYMRALHVMGERGGWPMSVFLTPEREPFFGGTYFPKDQFLQALDRIENVWENDRARIEEVTGQVVAELERSSGMVGVDGGGEVPSVENVEHAMAAIDKSFDPEHGGFSDAPKFPQPSKLSLLLEQHARTGDERALKMATTTLDAMAAGGIHDHIGGGFHRYATDARWRVPHFEKMLYGNAQLLRLYARAWELTDNERYRAVADGIAAYIERTLTDADTGLFYAAQSSLLDGVEGKSYSWTRAQVEAALGDDRLTRLAVLLYGLDGEPLVGEPELERGAHVLYRARSPSAVADRIDGLDTEAVAAARPEIERRLLEARQQRKQASVGTKHVLGWNAMTIDALAYAGRVLERPEWVERAERAAVAVEQRLYDVEGGPLHAIRGDRGRVRAQLSDYAALAAAQAQLARAHTDAERDWRGRAQATARDMIGTLWNPERGVFDRRPSSGDLLLQTNELQDGAVPAGNSMAVRALVDLAHSGQASLAPYAATVLRAHRSMFERNPAALTHMLSGLGAYHAAELPPTMEIPQPAVARVSRAHHRPTPMPFVHETTR
ncbi:MAG: thioredoxin domain-containing protein [Halofilum sp. (in: g-proteobacteria)]